ncbi:Allantoate permease [Exophiala dermatitidis]|uniref:MFS transporter, ACS family, allantoate permease n=3 Tax=Exophiala dermatitidis TaxID=5970 RepID=H6C7F7_EXODN|nr:MFS transporter, ACS family, allantoate permease [Exophiala dermatitidis NIH/UT8656]KAJ4525884.1 Allantoate permease [Exophiala dermatitidis]EHY59653.1 MFS transporter, ACS family, allantoate permease [Exophiala dermatitidis NIH/UT8656]KAJ4527169.1 Allantoate permease [Exophiala dermatitidis]KAJ4532890.1 Allantoate permease [Exophiala dermatitidis]KAJ4538839.1 Allantoate permease [Exophiala dermatitidis]
MADMETDEKSVPIQTLPGGRAVSPVNLEGQRASISSTKAAQKIIAHSNDADEAMKAFASGEVLEINEATNKRLLRIIDWHLMPLLCVIYGLNYLDKTTLSYASIMGIKKDLGLKGDDYQWLGSMFYFGYLAWEYPTNRLLQRLPLAKYSAFCVVAWGVVLALFATVSGFGGAVAIRFFLGVFEAAVTPGFALFTSQWYTKREQGTRTGIWFSFNGFGQIFGGLVAYGIAVGARKHGTAIASWKIVFLVNGCLTAALGIIFFFVMPDNQLNARWLKPRDRVLAVERVRINQQGIGNKHFKMYQLKEALTDPLSWAFVFYALIADIPNGGISNFFSQLIVSFGYTPEESLLYGTPGGAVEVVALMFCGWLGDKLGQRILVSMSGLTVALLGMILIVALPLDNNSGRLAGYYLTQASPTPFVALLSLVATNVAGYTKKTTVAAMYLVAYCAGNIIGPQCFQPKDAPRYTPAEITIIVCWGVCLVDLLFIWWYCKRQNRKKAMIRAEPGYIKLENQEWLDLTDRENPEFVYSL